MTTNQKKLSWHSLGTNNVIKETKTSNNGLSEKEAQKRIKKFGLNKLEDEKPLSRLRLFLEQLKSPLIYILVIAGTITFVLKDFTDTIIILGAVLLNTLVGYYQEKKANGALAELKKVLRARAIVIRDGNEKEIVQEQVVPGDIILLRPGDKVSADARIIESRDLKINESILTGEWLTAEKNKNILDEKTPLADRDNMAYMGTNIEAGWGKAVVVNTGVGTETGQVAQIISSIDERKTPYQKKLSRFGRIVGSVIMIISLGIFIEGMLSGGDFIEIFTTSIAVAVAAIPEGLPVAMTVILALGMQRVLKRRGLVRKLVSAETLGSTSIILTDKTGTLTEAKMEVASIYTDVDELLKEKTSASKEKTDKDIKSEHLFALRAAVFCSESFIENPDDPMAKWIARGRPTDKAIVVAGYQAGVFKKEIEREHKTLDSIPFDSLYKYSASLNESDGKKNVLYVMGAPEVIMEASTSVKTQDKNIGLGPANLKKLKKRHTSLTRQGFRVLAVAYKEISKKPTKGDKINKEDLSKLVFAGLIALHDPIRKDTKTAIDVCREAGMRPIIVTGDHALTAQAVAEKLGFLIKKENVLTGSELSVLKQKDFEKRLPDLQIYARVEPAQKLRIAKAWQKRGEVVAMTGDGINDAPALKQADVGVALGSGTDVAKEVSDLVLLNDKFSIIVAAVEEGRVIIDNIRKVITYLLSDSFTEVILISVAIGVAWATDEPLLLPVLAGQILWVNLIEDGLPNVALAFEKKEKDLLKQKPQPQNTPLLTKEMKILIFIIGVITDIFLLALFFWLLKYYGHNQIDHIRSVIFAGLAINSLFYVFSCRSLKRNIWHMNPFSNKFLVTAVGFGFLALVAALYLPIFNSLLKTVPLNIFDWFLLLIIGVANVVLIEGTKKYFIVRHEAF